MVGGGDAHDVYGFVVERLPHVFDVQRALAGGFFEILRRLLPDDFIHVRDDRDFGVGPFFVGIQMRLTPAANAQHRHLQLFVRAGRLFFLSLN